MFQKGLALIIIVLILTGVILLVGGGYYLGTKRSETFQERLSRQNPVITSVPNIVPSPTPTTKNFNFIFRYGVGANNELDTFKGILTKDLVSGDPPTITASLILTENDLLRIYNKMIKIDFFNYPDNFISVAPPGEYGLSTSPSSSYYFKVVYDSKTKELTWKDESYYPKDEKRMKLLELTTFIQEIIESKEEYKKLPEIRGGYL